MMALTLGGLAKIYAYFNQGAIKTDLVSKAIQESTIHDPVYEWDLSQSLEGVKLDEYTRQEVQDAYTYAWYILNASLDARKNLGLEDRFSKKMVEKIEKGFVGDTNFLMQRAELNHKIKVHLFSYDRQLISFKDSEVRLVNRSVDRRTGQSQQSTQENNYEVVMGLEDGYWKIFELLQLPEVENIQSQNEIGEKQSYEAIKGINYYPSEHPWFDFWKKYNKITVEKDLQLIQELGFNHTRIFIPYALFGKGTLNQDMLNRLDHYLETCQSKNITVCLSLFDFPESYRIAYYPATAKHLKQLLERYQHHPAIVIWDLKNEADLDFESYGQGVVMDWLRLISLEAKRIAPNINMTVGWSNIKYASLLAKQLDLLSFHLYADIEEAEGHLRKLKKEYPNKEIYLSEFGMTSYQSRILPFGSTEKEQALFTRDVLAFIEAEEIEHYAFWTLYDFAEAPKEVIGWKPWIRSAQEKMGLLSITGEEKLVLQNFNGGKSSIENLSWYEKIKPSYFIISLLLLLTFLLKFKNSRI